MRLWPRRKAIDIFEPVRALVSLEGNPGVCPIRLDVVGVPEIKVKHVIEHKPRPRPTTIQPIIMDGEGREWRTMLINCNDRHTVPVYFPLGYLTGKPEDNAVQVGMRLELHYDPHGGAWLRQVGNLPGNLPACF